MLKIFLMVLAFTSLPTHAKDERNLVIKESGSTGKRVALVIGNGNYQSDNLPTLVNPTHDAEDIATALRSFGFEVIEKKNLKLEDMSDAIAEFGRKIANSDAALFYFAGHGLQVKGQNYLIPVDAKIESEAQVPFRSINVNQLLEEMDSAHSRANIVMLDACRNNPISGKFRSGATRGLAAPSSQPKGTVIVYATDPGNTALDGEGRNGLFTAGLLKAFKGNDLSLAGILTRASEEVESSSEQKQTPYINGPATLQKNFQFALGLSSQNSSLTPTSEGNMITPALDPAAIELSFWESIKDSTDPEDFRAYLSKYANGQFIAIARNRLKTPVPVAVRPELTSAPITEQPDKAALSIGSKGPGGGIVFYIDGTGAHGLEAKVANERNEMTWDAAIAAASAYGSGWHLPTKDELNLLYQQKTVVGGFADYDYWSSTEDDSGNARVRYFGDGRQANANKFFPLPVRAVRAF